MLLLDRANHVIPILSGWFLSRSTAPSALEDRVQAATDFSASNVELHEPTLLIAIRRFPPVRRSEPVTERRGVETPEPPEKVWLEPQPFLQLDR